MNVARWILAAVLLGAINTQAQVPTPPANTQKDRTASSDRPIAGAVPKGWAVFSHAASGLSIWLPANPFKAVQDLPGNLQLEIYTGQAEGVVYIFLVSDLKGSVHLTGKALDEFAHGILDSVEQSQTSAGVIVKSRYDGQSRFKGLDCASGAVLNAEGRAIYLIRAFEVNGYAVALTAQRAGGFEDTSQMDAYSESFMVSRLPN